MIKYVLALILIQPVLSGHPGWFARIRGGQLSHHPSSIYPRALSNIGYAYGHLKDMEDDEKEVINVKSTTSTSKKWSDNDYEEEDHFFHSLYHNNDDKVVTNVSSKKKSMEEEVDSEDEVMFGRLNDKLFHRRGGKKEEEVKSEVATMKMSLEEAFAEASFFE